ncbi:MAG TPA: type I DNA topoisomerase [Ignavibacteriaceae bacterium]|nr:type I DNA topoisomerase [Ignavibacteriaceae bacterium]
MSRNLVLVESPAKAKTINKYLGKNFIVEATIGHVKNLPKSKLGVDIEKNYQPQFVTIRGKGEIIKKIKSLAGKSKNIYIATDPDREGEAIAQDIAEIISSNGSSKNGANIHRVLFNEITRSGVEKAMRHPRSIDDSLVTSQRARRVMDRIIGYKMSPFLWKAVIDSAGDSLSAGRVQSVALKIICDREDQIQKFIPTEYWSIQALFQTEKKEKFKAKLFSVDGKDIKIPPKPGMAESEWKDFLEIYSVIGNEASAAEIFDRIKAKKNFEISGIIKRHTRRNAPAPFITSTLQAEASKNLKMRPKQTMMLAQKLYEGIELGKEGSAGLITYMRTDSTRISEEMISDARNFIKANYGDKYLPETPNIYEKKGSNIQDAHEAIRPTSLQYAPDFIKQFVDPKTFKLYELIWNRFIASQMNPALLETTIIEVKADEFLFKAFGTAVQFNGFMQVYDELADQVKNAEDKDEYRNEIIPLGLEKGNKLHLDKLHKAQHFTKPPARFTESTLIKELESKGIGRPSTYSLIVSTIQDRKYVNFEDRRLMPTQRGKDVNKILVENFPDIINEGFTAEMEGELDQIAQGENNYVKVLNDFYLPFSKSLKQVENKIEKIYCDVCGSEMVIKFGRYGKFLACSNYPKCKNIKSLKELSQQSQEPEYTGEICEKCGARTVYRKGKFGRFIGCERYPDCDFVKNITLGVQCPKCHEGEIVERKSRRNRTFYGCSRYPGCDFVSWYKPVPQECPNKDSAYMEQRYSAKKGEYLRCPKCGEELILEENKEVE